MKSALALVVALASPIALALGPVESPNLTPAGSPDFYANLAFTALTPCRIMDTRPSQGGSGAWLAGSSNLVKIGPYATGYASGPGAQGGSPTSCGLDALAGPGQIAAILAAVSTLEQAGPGFLSFYPESTATPTSVSQRYQPGFTQTAFVLIPTNLVGTVSAFGDTSATTNVIIDVVGYLSASVADGVTSVGSGTGLSGGPITSTGTLSIATAYQLPQSCATNQVPKWSGSAWTCAADANSGGTVTAVSATAPLQTSGGSAPNISFPAVAAGQLLASTGASPAFTGSPSISGNLTLTQPSSPGAGNIMKGASGFIHNTGSGNTFLGVGAGTFYVTGSSNTGVGNSALPIILAGNQNTAIGLQALFSNSNGSRNTAVGSGTLGLNTVGSDNNAVGVLALASNTIGVANTAIGTGTLSNNTTGASNVAVGHGALANNSTGSENIAIGVDAGSLLAFGTNIAIGHPGNATDVGAIRIGNLNHTKTFITGIRGAGTSPADAVPVLISSSGQLGTINSSRYVKDDIADMDAATNALMKLRPVTFHYKSDQAASGRTLQYGLIAEEVDKVYPGLIAHSADGKIETVMYQFLPPMLLNEYQKQQRTIDKQAARIAALETQVVKILDELQSTFPPSHPHFTAD